MSMKTVGILIISEDIVQNRKHDNISKFLLQELDDLQYKVSKLTVIVSSESAIVKELELLIRSYDIIIAVGEKCSSLLKALSIMTSNGLERNEELINVLKEMREHYENDEILLPIQAKLLIGNNVYPVIHFQRIFLLKEKHLKPSFNKILKNHLNEYRTQTSLSKTVYISQNGNSLDDWNKLNKIAITNATVTLSKNDQSYVCNIKSSHLSSMIEVEEKIKSKFDPYRLVFKEDSNEWDKIYSSQEKHIQSAIESIERCFEQYGVENVFISFNGGKDCTVLLHLVLTVLRKKYPDFTEPIFCLYVQSESPFPEQEQFINQMQSYFGLKMLTIKAGIKQALQETLQKYSNYKACFMGTRRTDPFSNNLKVFQMTDKNWPKIMRVSPLLDWHYSDVWDYLLYYKVPYCPLYDMGYTSLGNTVNTTRNPSLVSFDDVLGKEIYLPAYKLLKEEKERNGRTGS